MQIEQDAVAVFRGDLIGLENEHRHASHLGAGHLYPELFAPFDLRGGRGRRQLVDQGKPCRVVGGIRIPVGRPVGPGDIGREPGADVVGNSDDPAGHCARSRLGVGLAHALFEGALSERGREQGQRQHEAEHGGRERTHRRFLLGLAHCS